MGNAGPWPRVGAGSGNGQLSRAPAEKPQGSSFIGMIQCRVLGPLSLNRSEESAMHVSGNQGFSKKIVHYVASTVQALNVEREVNIKCKKRSCHEMQHRRCSHTVTWNRIGVYRHQKNASLQTPVPERALHGLNHMFGILGRHTAVGTPITTSSSDVHPHRGFVHVVIIHHLATQHPRPGLTLAKDWGRVAPEVAAVACHPARERIAGPCSSSSFTEPVACGSEEGVDAQKR